MRTYLARRLAVTLAVVGLVVLATAAAPAILDGPSPPTTQFPEYGADRTVSEQLPARGEIQPGAVNGSDRGTGVVVIDDTHSNRFQRDEVTPLVRGLDRAGYDVRFHENGPLSSALAEADALVIIDPGQEYSRQEARLIDNFTDAGGRVVVFGEPNRIEVQVGFFGASLTTVRSQLAQLGSTFGLHFGTRYVYDMRRHDGNYKHVLVSPGPRADLGGVQRVVTYTATEVRAVGGGTNATTVLVTGAGARTARSDEQRRHAIAVRRGNVLAVGDATLLSADRYNVGDNERFLAHVVGFMVAADAAGFDPNATNTTDGGGTTGPGPGRTPVPGPGYDSTRASPTLTAAEGAD